MVSDYKKRHRREFSFTSSTISGYPSGAPESALADKIFNDPESWRTEGEGNKAQMAGSYWEQNKEGGGAVTSRREKRPAEVAVIPFTNKYKLQLTLASPPLSSSTTTSVSSGTDSEKWEGVADNHDHSQLHSPLAVSLFEPVADISTNTQRMSLLWSHGNIFRAFPSPSDDGKSPVTSTGKHFPLTGDCEIPMTPLNLTIRKALASPSPGIPSSATTTTMNSSTSAATSVSRPAPKKLNLKKPTLQIQPSTGTVPSPRVEGMSPIAILSASATWSILEWYGLPNTPQFPTPIPPRSTNTLLAAPPTVSAPSSPLRTVITATEPLPSPFKAQIKTSSAKTQRRKSRKLPDVPPVPPIPDSARNSPVPPLPIASPPESLTSRPTDRPVSPPRKQMSPPLPSISPIPPVSALTVPPPLAISPQSSSKPAFVRPLPPATSSPPVKSTQRLSPEVVQRSFSRSATPPPAPTKRLVADAPPPVPPLPPVLRRASPEFLPTDSSTDVSLIPPLSVKKKVSFEPFPSASKKPSLDDPIPPVLSSAPSKEQSLDVPPVPPLPPALRAPSPLVPLRSSLLATRPASVPPVPPLPKASIPPQFLKSAGKFNPEPQKKLEDKPLTSSPTPMTPSPASSSPSLAVIPSKIPRGRLNTVRSRSSSFSTPKDGMPKSDIPPRVIPINHPPAETKIPHGSTLTRSRSSSTSFTVPRRAPAPPLPTRMSPPAAVSAGPLPVMSATLPTMNSTLRPRPASIRRSRSSSSLVVGDNVPPVPALPLLTTIAPITSSQLIPRIRPQSMMRSRSASFSAPRQPSWPAPSAPLPAPPALPPRPKRPSTPPPLDLPPTPSGAGSVPVPVLVVTPDKSESEMERPPSRGRVSPFPLSARGDFKVLRPATPPVKPPKSKGRFRGK